MVAALEARLQRQVDAVATNLSREFGGHVPTEIINRCFTESVEAFADAPVREFIATMVERSARRRLLALAYQTR
jgi:hypothetical protein